MTTEKVCINTVLENIKVGLLQRQHSQRLFYVPIKTFITVFYYYMYTCIPFTMCNVQEVILQVAIHFLRDYSLDLQLPIIFLYYNLENSHTFLSAYTFVSEPVTIFY